MPEYEVNLDVTILIEAEDDDAAHEAAVQGVEVRDMPHYLSEPEIYCYDVSRIR